MTIRFDPPITSLQERAVKEAYLTLYAFVNAKKSDHFVFTSSSAEGVNHAVFAAYVDITRKTGKNHFLCSSLDEAASIMSMGRLQELGCVFQTIPAGPDGKITKKNVAEMITPRTAMISMSWANGLTGVLQPVAEVAELCRERGILFHVEGSHVLGKGDFGFEDSCADILSFGGVPRGTGGLFFRETLEMSPFILGGHEQGQMRGGAFSISGLIDLAKWAKDERGFADHYGMEVARLRAYFEDSLCTQLPFAQPLFQNVARVPHISCILFPGIVSDALCYRLEQKEVHTMCGGNRFQHLVHLLKTSGISEPDCHCGLSFGFSPEVTEEEIDATVVTIVETVQQLKTYSEHILA